MIIGDKGLIKHCGYSYLGVKVTSNDKKNSELTDRLKKGKNDNFTFECNIMR